MSVFVVGIGIIRGQYYWVLDIGCLSWYRSNPILALAQEEQLKSQLCLAVNYVYCLAGHKFAYQELYCIWCHAMRDIQFIQSLKGYMLEGTR